MSLVEGLLMGFAFAMPIGSQNIFVINSALGQGLPKSFRTAATVSLMDVTLGLACFFGMGAFLSAFPNLRISISLVGAAYIIWVAYNLLRTSFSATTGESSKQKDTTFRNIISAAFLLTWANPHALIDGTIMLGGQRATLDHSEVLPFVIGMSSASIVWFFALTGIVGILRSAFTSSTVKAIQVFCALILFYISFSLIQKSGVFL